LAEVLINWSNRGSTRTIRLSPPVMYERKTPVTTLSSVRHEAIKSAQVRNNMAT
jgi:hypothetical protein